LKRDGGRGKRLALGPDFLDDDWPDRVVLSRILRVMG
jgi:hypothetical protein